MSFVFNGLSCIDAQVQDGAFQLAGVDPRMHRAFVAPDRQRYGFGQGHRQQVFHAFRNHGDIGFDGGEVLFAGEGQKPLDQRNTEFDGVIDPCLQHGGLGGKLALQHVKISGDRGQNVAEVMGNFACHLAEAFHSPDFFQPLVDPFAFRRFGKQPNRAAVGQCRLAHFQHPAGGVGVFAKSGAVVFIGAAFER